MILELEKAKARLLKALPNSVYSPTFSGVEDDVLTIYPRWADEHNYGFDIFFQKQEFLVIYTWTQIGTDYDSDDDWSTGIRVKPHWVIVDYPQEQARPIKLKDLQTEIIGRLLIGEGRRND